MSLSRLDIVNFRNLASIKLEPMTDGFNFIFGNNGSGKTSLLEAIYYLSVGRSFRSTLASRIIRKSTNKFSLFAHISSHIGQVIPVGIERLLEGSQNRVRILGADVRSTAELANLIPVQLINSHCYNLLEAPSFRRKYLNWGAFHLSNHFLPIWRQFERTLKQRNTTLREQLSLKELNSWTQELVSAATLLNQLRYDYMQKLIPVLREIVKQLLPVDDLKMSYYPGWDGSLSYNDILTQEKNREIHLGYTQFGPHRADFKITINQASAKDILSRGQQKLLVCAMIVAQGALLHNAINKKTIYLVDDLPSELDLRSRSNLLSLLSKQCAQLFVTAVERSALERFLNHDQVRMFHVEHGNITEVERAE